MCFLVAVVRPKGIPRELLHREWVGHARVFINVAEIYFHQVCHLVGQLFFMMLDCEIGKVVCHYCVSISTK